MSQLPFLITDVEWLSTSYIVAIVMTRDAFLVIHFLQLTSTIQVCNLYMRISPSNVHEVIGEDMNRNNTCNHDRIICCHYPIWKSVVHDHAYLAHPLPHQAQQLPPPQHPQLCTWNNQNNQRKIYRDQRGNDRAMVHACRRHGARRGSR